MRQTRPRQVHAKRQNEKWNLNRINYKFTKKKIISQLNEPEKEKIEENFGKISENFQGKIFSVHFLLINLKIDIWRHSIDQIKGALKISYRSINYWAHSLMMLIAYFLFRILSLI